MSGLVRTLWAKPVIADSGEGYFNKQDCLHGIELVKGAYNAPVFEV